MRDLYRAYRGVAHSAVERYGGQVIQFQGDGIVACFGHPEAHEDDARRAVLAGPPSVRATPPSPASSTSTQVRVGVHTGMAVVANFGAARGGAGHHRRHRAQRRRPPPVRRRARPGGRE